MSIIRPIIYYDLSSLRRGSWVSVPNPNRLLFSSTSKYGNNFLANRGLLSLGILSFSGRVLNKTNTKMDVTVYSSVQPGGSPSNSWRNWIFGMLISIILPFWRNKWAPLLTLKREVDTVVETIENVVNVVEVVAEEVENVADEIAKKLPEGGKLKEAVCAVEHIAKEAAKDAHLAEEFLEKVEEVEKDVEALIEPILAQSSSREDDEQK
ncbi:PREDICTED: uncharacterized protein LOC104608631 [Nelumbo nucifera]|uniref:Uncharacterized protein LOC104608631 n=1 Tax=Nelumbo nucifera TaxID=4432 RepID=A0A1U8B1D2_NELNU|nr:PREDICTED: uncharacterized protein LOC104608631 [Nelumbo nucifera]